MVLHYMSVYSQENVVLPTYKLKDVGHVWFEQWEEERPIREVPVNWESFKTTFLDRFILLELRER